MQHADTFGYLDHAKTLMHVENHVGRAKFFPRLAKTLVTLVCFGKYYLLLDVVHIPLSYKYQFHSNFIFSQQPWHIQLARFTDSQWTNTSTYANTHTHTHHNKGSCTKQRMTVDNVNILLISSAFEVLSGLKAFTIRSLSSLPDSKSHKSSAAVRHWSSSDGQQDQCYSDYPAAFSLIWLWSDRYGGLMRSDRFGEKWQKCHWDLTKFIRGWKSKDNEMCSKSKCKCWKWH